MNNLESALLKKYKEILLTLDNEVFNSLTDKYSGIFLPKPFPEYWQDNSKIMLVGRETAGWTIKGQTGISSVIKHIMDGTLDTLINAATDRHQNHLTPNNGLAGKSKFKQYHARIAQELGLSKESILYCNLFAWDYNRSSISQRPIREQLEIKRISLQLLAAQIYYLKPDFIIFSAGLAAGNNKMIKQLFENHFTGYTTDNKYFTPRKLWPFKAANSHCFRIAHPRAGGDHPLYKKQVIEIIKKMIKEQVA